MLLMEGLPTICPGGDPGAESRNEKRIRMQSRAVRTASAGLTGRLAPLTGRELAFKTSGSRAGHRTVSARVCRFIAGFVCPGSACDTAVRTASRRSLRDSLRVLPEAGRAVSRATLPGYTQAWRRQSPFIFPIRTVAPPCVSTAAAAASAVITPGLA